MRIGTDETFVHCYRRRDSSTEHSWNFKTFNVGFKQHLQVRFSLEPSSTPIERGCLSAYVSRSVRIALRAASRLGWQECDRIRPSDWDCGAAVPIGRDWSEKAARTVVNRASELG